MRMFHFISDETMDNIPWLSSMFINYNPTITNSMPLQYHVHLSIMSLVLLSSKSSLVYLLKNSVISFLSIYPFVQPAINLSNFSPNLLFSPILIVHLSTMHPYCIPYYTTSSMHLLLTQYHQLQESDQILP